MKSACLEELVYGWDPCPSSSLPKPAACDPRSWCVIMTLNNQKGQGHLGYILEFNNYINVLWFIVLVQKPLSLLSQLMFYTFNE